MTGRCPSFIPEIGRAPLSFPWKGSGHHIGPTQVATLLFDRLGGLTTNGQITLCGGLLLWGACRLRLHVDAEYIFDFVEAAFAYQVDWRYANRDARPAGDPPDQPPPASAIMELNRYMWRALNAKKYWDSYYTPVAEVFHASHVTRHVLPADAKVAFDQWFEAVVERLERVAPKPAGEFRRRDQFERVEEWEAWVAPHRGLALPPTVLDPNVDYQPSLRRQLLAEFLPQLSFGRNPYLRTPEEMKALGFDGEPYRLADA